MQSMADLGTKIKLKIILFYLPLNRLQDCHDWTYSGALLVLAFLVHGGLGAHQDRPRNRRLQQIE